MRSRFVLPIVTLAAALAFAGCQTEPIPERVERPEPPPRERVGPPPEERPSVVGDYLVYPVQWRRCEEVAFELYDLLFPKYGPYLRIVPDSTTNSLLIYLTPKASRLQGEEGEQKAPATEQF